MKVTKRLLPAGIQSGTIKYVGKRVRLARGYTVRGLAEATNIAPSSITKWENGHNLPDLTCVGILAQVLEVSPWDLLEYNAMPKSA